MPCWRVWLYSVANREPLKCFKQVNDLIWFALLERSVFLPESNVHWREWGTKPEKTVWESWSLGQSRGHDLCQPANVGMDVISRNDVKKAKFTWRGDWRERELGGEVMVDYSVSGSNSDTIGGTAELDGEDETDCALLGFSFLTNKRRKTHFYLINCDEGYWIVKHLSHLGYFWAHAGKPFTKLISWATDLT